MKKNEYAILFSLGIVLATIFSAGFAMAAYDYVPFESIPGSGRPVTFQDYILAIYKFALWAVGIAALLMITIGGFMYFTAAGNTSKLEKAKGVITDAIFGIIAVMSAWLILYIINPDLVNINLSSLDVMKNIENMESYEPGESFTPIPYEQGQDPQDAIDQEQLQQDENIDHTGEMDYMNQ